MCPKAADAAYTAVQTCSTREDAPLLVYVSKMVAVPAAAIPRQARAAAPAAAGGEVFLAFGRVFSGQLSDQQAVHVLSAAYDPTDPAAHRQEVQVGCYCSGPALIPLY